MEVHHQNVLELERVLLLPLIYYVKLCKIQVHVINLSVVSGTVATVHLPKILITPRGDHSFLSFLFDIIIRSTRHTALRSSFTSLFAVKTVVFSFRCVTSFTVILLPLDYGTATEETTARDKS
jgi:hypothetical protein